jgi:hypothetical protein
MLSRILDPSNRRLYPSGGVEGYLTAPSAKLRRSSVTLVVVRARQAQRRRAAKKRFVRPMSVILPER